jgi:hypothetical protein
MIRRRIERHGATWAERAGSFFEQKAAKGTKKRRVARRPMIGTARRSEPHWQKLDSGPSAFWLQSAVF